MDVLEGLAPKVIDEVGLDVGLEVREDVLEVEELTPVVKLGVEV